VLGALIVLQSCGKRSVGQCYRRSLTTGHELNRLWKVETRVENDTRKKNNKTAVSVKQVNLDSGCGKEHFVQKVTIFNTMSLKTKTQ